MTASQTRQPVFPRRAFVAALLSAVLAVAAISLGITGGLTKTDGGAFQFSRGLTFVSGGEEELRGLLTEALPDERIHVTILGHTGSVGDPEANLELSEDRAAVAQSVAEKLGISSDRITARGVGGASPLPKEDGESDRAYQARLARVEVTLQVRR